MERYLDQLANLSANVNGYQSEDVPIFVAGDIFDKWNSPPELINFAIDNLPPCYAIPGQHDLPYHNLRDIHKSAYHTLVQAGKISHIDAGSFILVGDIKCSVWVWGFPWGVPLVLHQTVRESNDPKVIHVALVHRYAWMEGHTFPGAPPENHYKQLARQLKGFDFGFFGDNHKGFESPDWTDCAVINCGGFIRRKSDETTYQPSVWLLRSDMTVERRYLDTSADQIAKRDDGNQEVLNTKGFIKMLQSLDPDVDALDFKERLEQLLKNPKLYVTSKCMRVIVDILESI